MSPHQLGILAAHTKTAEAIIAKPSMLPPTMGQPQPMGGDLSKKPTKPQPPLFQKLMGPLGGK